MNRRRWCVGWIMVWSLTMPAVALSGADKAPAAGLWLITPEEAAMEPAFESGPPGGGAIDAGREDISAGPQIEVLKPLDGGHVPSPVEVAVRFVPRLGPVDLASLKVSIVKFITIDITDRVKPFATTEGIQVKEANIPSGSHRVRISVADTAGGISVKEVTMEVR